MSSTRRVPRRTPRSWADRLLLAEAAVALAAARLAVGAVAFRHIARGVGLAPGSSDVDHVASEEAVAVGRAVEVAAARLPWSSTCLRQAVAAAAMLRRRRLSAVLCLGVARDVPVAKDSADANDYDDVVSGGLVFHAWVCSGDAVVTGAGDQGRFAFVGTYHSALP